MKIKKVLYAVGNDQLESYLTDKGLDDNSKIVGTVVHRGAILPKLHELSQTITGEITLILNEGLPDVTEGTILEICKEIRIHYPQVRILLLAGEHQIGDEFLTALLNMGVYDVVFGEKLNINRVIEVLNNPNTYADALSFISESNLSLADVKESKEPEVVTEVVITPEKAERPLPLSVFARKRMEKSDADRNIGIPNSKNLETYIPSIHVQSVSGEWNPAAFKERTAGTGKRQISEPFPVKREEKKALGHGKKQSFIFGVSDSYFAREIGLSLANILAGKSRVLLCDLTHGPALLPARLDVRVNEGLSYFADNINADVDLSMVPVSPYYLSKNKAVSPFLYILAYQEADRFLTLEEVGGVTEILSGYDYSHIVYVCDRMFDMDMVRLMTKACNKTLLVSDQYSVSVNRAYDMIAAGRISPGLVVTQAVAGVRPEISDLKKLYGIQYGEELAINRKTLLKADAMASPYIGVGRDKKKIQRLAAFLCD